MKLLQTFTGGIAQTNSYLLEAPEGLLLVDAAEGVAEWLAQQGVQVSALLLTHQHFDHVLGAAEVVAAHACPVYAWSAFDRELTLERLFGAAVGSSFSVPAFVVTHVLQGQTELSLLGEKAQLFHIPGHSPDSVCFFWCEGTLLLGGDVLFLEGVGRTDFPGGSFSQLAEGIQRDLWPLPPATRVLPGHGDETSIGYEKEANPYLSGL